MNEATTQSQDRLATLLALASRQGYVTWRQLELRDVEDEAGSAILDALLHRGVELIDAPDDVAAQEKAYQSHLAEMDRKPCWQLGDGWHFQAEADPFPCRSAAPTTIRLRCGYSLDQPPCHEQLEYRLIPAPAGYAGEWPSADLGEPKWEPLSGVEVAPGEVRLRLPPGVAFLEFQVLQPDYRPEPHHLTWRLVVDGPMA